ncbi:hypothetical protein Glove_217g260 [Diversispora epigaea]|uniref:Uncharacterized protein n=1 Tax=Diversispora epigaea TaxID=1348612 RepID=A0A397IN59_9GLOM|nr:hypothetical protein Glove_217g260 [Diversispora epigaea]
MTWESVGNLFPVKLFVKSVHKLSLTYGSAEGPNIDNQVLEGTYPITPKLTQKLNCSNLPQYPILNNYIVKTEIAEKGEGRAEWSVNSTKSALAKINWKNSKLSGSRVFRFDIEPLHNIHIQMNPSSIIITKVNKQIRPFENITSHSQQHKRFKSFGKGIGCCSKSSDEALLGHNGYKHLAAVVSNQNINQPNINNYNRNGAFRSLVSLLKILIPIWTKGEKSVIIPGDTLYIKLGEIEEMQEKNKTIICLYIRKETYEILDRVDKIFTLQLMDLKQNGIIDENGNYWPIEFFFSGNEKSSIFPVIDLLNYIPDELYTLLHISDILMESLFKDLFRKNDFE